MRLEDRLRETLRAEADRFQPELAISPELTPRTTGPSWLVIAGAAAGVAVLIGVTALLTRPSLTIEPPSNTLSPPATTAPQPVTTAPHPVTTAPQPVTTNPYVPPELTPFIPDAQIENGVASLVVTFPDGSTAEVSWPEDLDLTSGGVYPYGWGLIPFVNASDFFIRQGSVEEVVAQFGRPILLREYPDGQGGQVGSWRPEGWGVGYLGFQFGPWAVLAHQQGMSRDASAIWAQNLRGETTPEGLLRLSTDEPLRLVIAGEYPSPMSMTFESPGGQVELVPGECQPAQLGDSVETGAGEFVDWCDRNGLMTIRIVGPSDFQQAVFDGLEIGPVHLVGIEGPDATGSYAHLEDELERARVRWEQASFKDAYRLTVRGHISIAAVDFAALVRDGQVTIERGNPRPLADPPTVESLFDIVEAAMAVDSPVSVRFHPEFAYPTWIRWGADPAVDDGAGLTIHFEPLSD